MCIYISDTIILTLLFLSGFVGGLFIHWVITIPTPPTINPHRPEWDMIPHSSRRPPKPMPPLKKPKK